MKCLNIRHPARPGAGTDEPLARTYRRRGVQGAVPSDHGPGERNRRRGGNHQIRSSRSEAVPVGAQVTQPPLFGSCEGSLIILDDDDLVPSTEDEWNDEEVKGSGIPTERTA